MKKDRDVYRLKFEEDGGAELEVSRRYVLDVNGK